MWRLAWTKDGGRTFALPPGRYAWVTYRLVEGAWHLSATGSPLARVEVRAGQRARLEAKDGVALGVRGAARAGAVQAEVHLGGAAGGGLTLYRDGRRIPLTVTVLDAAGGALGSAPLRYG